MSHYPKNEESHLSSSYSDSLIIAGRGNPLLIVHGGPGLSHSYLYQPLLPLSTKFTLIFYDQIGCGNNSVQPTEATASNTIDQFASIYRQQYHSCAPIVFAHSWGAYVVIAAQRKHRLFNPDTKLIFCNPCPLTSARSEQAGARLLARMEKDTLDEVNILAAKFDDCSGARLMKLALPAYCSSSRNPPDLALEYRPVTYSAVMGSLANYDLTRDVIDLGGLITVIMGADDYITTSDTEELNRQAQKKYIIPETGHFAFAESPDVILPIIASVID